MRFVPVIIASLLFVASCFSMINNVQASGEECWAVLLEMNEFPEGWSDLLVDYINTERMQAALMDSGFQSSHIQVVNGYLSIDVVQEAVEWLSNKSDSGSIVMLYIFTHGMWMRNMLLWNSWFPDAWKQLNVSKKILIIDTCLAEEFFEPLKSDLDPHISLGCCAADEVSWAGLEEEGLPIIGSVWNYYFSNALCNSSADLNYNGLVSIEEAFNFSTPLVQKYMNETVFTVPEFLQSYHDLGIYPENHDVYPHPTIDDGYSDQLVIPELPLSLIQLLFITATMLTIIICRRKRISTLYKVRVVYAILRCSTNILIPMTNRIKPPRISTLLRRNFPNFPPR